jgi:GNAT superfamily N-acetyltransferase
VALSLLDASPGAARASEFTVSLRSAGQLLGGIYAAVCGRTCELQHLYVDPEHRGSGVGRRLVTEAEREAARRGCTQVVLFTHASLGERYYPALGYSLVARVDDYPEGDAALWFRKDLGPRGAG